VPDQGVGKHHPILKYAFQFAGADRYVIRGADVESQHSGHPEAYIDYICVTGITFKYTASGPVGLCQGCKAVHITSRGGAYSDPPFSQFEMGDRYLRTILGFLGIVDFKTIAADKLDIIGMDVEGILRERLGQAAAAAKAF
jgi:FMN-dependent NADH-azoreductase